MRGISRTLLVAGTLAVALAAAGCAGTDDSGSAAPSAPAEKATLTLYNAQHEDLMKVMIEAFTKESGIKVEIRSGEDPDMANQIVQEGAASPADVFVTENSPAMTLVAGKGGEIQSAVIYHYYWYQDRAEAGTNSKNVELHFFTGKDAGGFLGVSGAGVVKASKHPAEAQSLVKFLTGKNGQQVLADSDALEYSISADVPTNPKLKPLSELSPPDVEISSLNGPKVVELMQQAGLL